MRPRAIVLSVITNLFISCVAQKSYQKHYDNFNKPLQLDTNLVQINEDESRELLSRSEEESGKDPDTKGIPKAVSTSVSVCASGIESVSKEKTPAINEAKTDVTEKVQNHYDKHPIQASLSDCHNNVEWDEDFTAKDLLGFAWQVARGMVSYVSVITLLFSVNGVFRKPCEGYNSSRFFVEGGGGTIEDAQCSNTADRVHYPTDVRATGQEWLEYLRHRLLGYNIPTYYPTAPSRAQITRPSSKNIL